MNRLTINLATETSVSYPDMVACFSDSIIRITQHNTSMGDVTLTVGSIWSETRTPIYTAAWSVVTFDLQTIAREYMRKADMFGTMTEAPLNDNEARLHTKLTVELSVQIDSSTTVTAEITPYAFFGAYTIGEQITPTTEYIYAPRVNGYKAPVIINLPPKSGGFNTRVVNTATGVVLDDDAYDSRYVNLQQWDTMNITIKSDSIHDMDSYCSRYDHPFTIYAEEVDVCGGLFRFINSVGMVRYIGFDIAEEGEATTSSMNVDFDDFTQKTLSSDLIFPTNHTRKSTTSFITKFKASSISDKFLKQYKDFARSAFIQIADTTDPYVVTWRGVRISDISIYRKRKENLTDVSITVVTKTEQNPY